MWHNKDACAYMHTCAYYACMYILKVLSNSNLRHAGGENKQWKLILI